MAPDLYANIMVNIVNFRFLVCGMQKRPSKRYSGATITYFDR